MFIYLSDTVSGGTIFLLVRKGHSHTYTIINCKVCEKGKDKNENLTCCCVMIIIIIALL